MYGVFVDATGISGWAWTGARFIVSPAVSVYHAVAAANLLVTAAVPTQA
jgi:hypothetical protein